MKRASVRIYATMLRVDVVTVDDDAICMLFCCLDAREDSVPQRIILFLF